MTDRALFIGVGGSGGKTLRYIWRDLESWLNTNGWKEGMPDIWQFLHVDSPSSAEKTDSDAPVELLSSERYLGLAQRGVNYTEYISKLALEPEISGGWLPSPHTDYGDLSTGAAQRRAIGRVLILDGLSEVKDRIEEMLRKTTSATALGQQKRLGQSNTVNADRLLVCIVTSLGGGTGSGMHQDISLILRSLASSSIEKQALANHFSVIYSPDIFDPLQAESRASVVPNSVAAISEMLAAHHSEEGLSDYETRILRSANVLNMKMTGSRAAAVHFIQGLENGVLSFSDTDDVYRTTARSLSAFLTDESISQFLHNSVLINKQSYETPDGIGGIASAGSTGEEFQLASSFGYANVSLGQEKFIDYGSERLARALTDKLKQSQDDVEQLKASNKIEELSRSFAVKANAAEHVPLTQNEITNQITQQLLTSLSIDSLFDEFSKKIEKIIQQKEQSSQHASSSSNISYAGSTELPKFRNEIDETFLNNVTVWSKSAVPNLLNATIDSIAEEGVNSTIAFLENLSRDLSERSKLLKRVSSESTSKPKRRTSPTVLLSTSLKKNKSSFFGRASKIATSNVPNFGQASLIDQIKIELKLGQEKEQKQHSIDSFIGEILEDFSLNVVLPLKTSIEDFRSRFVGEFEVRPSPSLEIYSKLASDDASDWIRQAPNERILVEVGGETGFKGQFSSRLISHLSPGNNDAGFQNVFPLALGEVFGGFDRSEGGYWPSGRFTKTNQRRITTDNAWGPRFLASKNPQLKACAAVFRLELSLDELLKDSRYWMMNRDGMSEFTNMKLSDYLNEDTAEGAERRSKFVSEFTVAFAMARPMARVNERVLMDYHSSAASTSLNPLTNKIIIPLKSKYEKEVESIKTLLRDSGVEFQFDEMTSDSLVQIARFLPKRVHPVVIDSMMKPMAREWQEVVNNPKKLNSFWVNRRAQPLEKFIPLGESAQKNLAKGWYLARLLGRISDKSIDNFLASGPSGSVEIWTKEGIKKFPELVLADVTSFEGHNLFPALAESFIIAFMDLSMGNREALDAYLELGKLGKDSSKWISQLIDPSFPNEGGIQATVTGVDALSRQMNFKKQLDDKWNDYQSSSIVPSGTPGYDSNIYNPQWELKELVGKAIEELKSQADTWSPKSSSKNL